MMPTTVDYELMRRLHDEGMSAAQIAAHLGCSRRTVSRWRRAEGLSPAAVENARHPADRERLAAAERLLDDGASYSEVARTLRMQRVTLVRHFPGRGWTPQQGGEYGAWIAHHMNDNERQAS